MDVVERDVVRVVVVDRSGRVLVLDTHDPTNPDLGRWWELPGGGLEPGETCRQAAVRELAEETGIVVALDAVGPGNWRRDATFRYRHRRYLNHETVVAVRLDVDTPPVVGDGRVDFEDEDYTGHRWCTVAELAALPERCYPGRLPELCARFLAGEQIDEPYEEWS